jgi:hypothetical protein
MNSLAMSTVALVVFVGAARAEFIEPPLPSAQPDTAMQPAPQPRSAPVIRHRIQPQRSPESIALLAHPHCADWFACGRYRMVGIGF